MIFGTTFVELFKEFLVGLKSLQIATSLGNQDSKKIITGDGSLQATIDNLEQKLDKILSKKHFIENN